MIPKGITKQEISVLEKRGYKFSDKKPNGQIIHRVIMIVHNPSHQHDSGYPFIRAFGELEDDSLIDMGWHDHYICNLPTNTDAIGKNIFRVMPWINHKWKVGHGFLSCSTLQLYEDGSWY
jgi:hypothetical protein